MTKTIGDIIDDLVAKHGHSRSGIFILEMALKKACGVTGTVKIDDVLLQYTPGYRMAKLGEKGRTDYEFRDLEVGDVFNFINPNGYSPFILTCKKTSARKYVDSRGASYTVGSIKAKVYHIVPGGAK